MTGLPELKNEHSYTTVQQIIDHVLQCGKLLMPATCQSVFYIDQRRPWMADMIKGQRSLLAQIMSERPEETGLVVDSVLKGQHALYAIRCVQTAEDVALWLPSLNPLRMQLHIYPMDDELRLLMVPLRALTSMECNC